MGEGQDPTMSTIVQLERSTKGGGVEVHHNSYNRQLINRATHPIVLIHITYSPRPSVGIHYITYHS